MFFLKNIFFTFVETANIRGRANRKQFNFYLLYLFAIAFFALFSDLTFLFSGIKSKYLIFFSGLSSKVFFISLIPFFSLSVRRLHDINFSAAWMLIYLPIIVISTSDFSYNENVRNVYVIFRLLAWILNLFLIFKKGHDDKNQYGEIVD